MIDYCLRFADKDEADAALFEDEVPKYAAVDVIGTIYKPTGEVLMVDGLETPQMKAVPGYHANVRHSEEAPELEAFQVFPDTPDRVWL
jgi:hypothetical protein